jgi:hypothetical protein
MADPLTLNELIVCIALSLTAQNGLSLQYLVDHLELEL